MAESGEDSVDVTVSVRDLYARAVAPLLSGEPDELSYGAVAMDYNLFGSDPAGHRTTRCRHGW